MHNNIQVSQQQNNVVDDEKEEETKSESGLNSSVPEIKSEKLTEAEEKNTSADADSSITTESTEVIAMSIVDMPLSIASSDTEEVEGTPFRRITTDLEEGEVIATNEVCVEDVIVTADELKVEEETTEIPKLKTEESVVLITKTTATTETTATEIPVLAGATTIACIKEEEEDDEEENTILLPEPDKQLVEKLTTIDDNLEESVITDEQVIAIKSEVEPNIVQEDVLAEPLGEEDNLYAANIDVKPIEGVLLQVEPLSLENDCDDKIGGRRRTTRKSAAAAAAAIRVKSEPSPEPDYELSRTRSGNKKYTRSPTSIDDDRKKGKLTKIKVEKISDEEDNIKSPSSIDIKKCRICLSKDALISIFSVEESFTVAEKVMNICSSVKINQKDQLPQFVCNNCVQSVNVAFNLKTLCEKTDKELRAKLKKNKTKKERITVKQGIFDCNNDVVDDSTEDIKEQDDDFVISNESAHSAAESDSDSDFGSKRKRAPRKKKTSGLKKRGRIMTVSGSEGGGSHKRNRSSKIGRQNIENGKMNQEDMSTDDELGPSKRKRSKIKSSKTDDDENNKKKYSKVYSCIYCEKKFNSQNLLREHKKIHTGQKPFICNICNKQFKLLGSYNSHLERHKKEEDNLICSQCNRHFPNKTEQKKHMIEIHRETVSFSCDICKRSFATQSRLDKHKKGKCPGYETGSKKEKKKNPELESMTSGKDLFKCVAPMTTTYWSDSFSD